MKLRKAVQTGPGQGLDGSRVGRVKGWTGQWLDGLVMVKWVKGWTCPVGAGIAQWLEHRTRD